MNTIAFIATFLLTLCPIQQTLRCIREGHSDGLAGGGLAMWFFGCLLMLIYLFMTIGSDIYVIVNFCFALCMCSVQLFYKLFPRRKYEAQKN